MARYRDALFWIVANDDTNWLDDSETPGETWAPSVTATLVADLFKDGDTEQVRKDLLAERKRQERET